MDPQRGEINDKALRAFCLERETVRHNYLLSNRLLKNIVVFVSRRRAVAESGNS